MSISKTQFVERLVQARSHICARPLQKTTIESDSSKVEVVGKNFCFFQISISLNTVVATYVCPPAASCALSLTVDCFPYKRLFFSIQRHINPVLMYVTFLKKKQQTMPDFLQQPNQHVRLPVQTPRRSNFKMSSTAHAHTETHSKSSQTATAACCCSHMFQLQSLNFVV